MCEAASWPDVKFVPAKNVERQGILALHAARSPLVKQQTMLANPCAASQRNSGSPFQKAYTSPTNSWQFLMQTRYAKGGQTGNYCNNRSEWIETFEAEIVAHARRDETARHLATISNGTPAWYALTEGATPITGI